MSRVEIRFAAELWVWDARPAEAWTFVTLPAEASVEIRELADDRPRAGFGSVRVAVTLGASTWRTSIFPDSRAGAYVLPIKRAIRRAEGIEAGDVADVRLEVLL